VSARTSCIELFPCDIAAFLLYLRHCCMTTKLTYDGTHIYSPVEKYVNVAEISLKHCFRWFQCFVSVYFRMSYG